MTTLCRCAKSLAALFALLLLLTCDRPSAAAAAARPVSFHLGAQCLCAQCAFDAQRALSKRDGVGKITLNLRLRRLEVALDETKCPVSTLALALRKMELGQDSALEWPLPPQADAAGAAKALQQVPGVKTAKADAKAHLVLLTFLSAPPVSLAQLEGAVPHA